MFRYASTNLLLSTLKEIKYYSTYFEKYYFRCMIANINRSPRTVDFLCDFFGVTSGTFINYCHNEPAEPMMKRIVNVVKLNVNAELSRRRDNV